MPRRRRERDADRAAGAQGVRSLIAAWPRRRARMGGKAWNSRRGSAAIARLERTFAVRVRGRATRRFGAAVADAAAARTRSRCGSLPSPRLCDGLRGARGCDGSRALRVAVRSVRASAEDGSSALVRRPVRRGARRARRAAKSSCGRRSALGVGLGVPRARRRLSRARSSPSATLDRRWRS